MADTVEALLNEIDDGDIDYQAFEEVEEAHTEQLAPARISSSPARACTPPGEARRSNGRIGDEAVFPRGQPQRAPKPIISWSVAMGGGGGGSSGGDGGILNGKRQSSVGREDRGGGRLPAKKPRNDVVAFLVERRLVDEQASLEQKLSSTAKLADPSKFRLSALDLAAQSRSLDRSPREGFHGDGRGAPARHGPAYIPVHRDFSPSLPRRSLTPPPRRRITLPLPDRSGHGWFPSDLTLPGHHSVPPELLREGFRAPQENLDMFRDPYDGHRERFLPLPSAWQQRMTRDSDPRRMGSIPPYGDTLRSLELERLPDPHPRQRQDEWNREDGGWQCRADEETHLARLAREGTHRRPMERSQDYEEEQAMSAAHWAAQRPHNYSPELLPHTFEVRAHSLMRAAAALPMEPPLAHEKQGGYNPYGRGGSPSRGAAKLRRLPPLAEAVAAAAAAHHTSEHSLQSQQRAVPPPPPPPPPPSQLRSLVRLLKPRAKVPLPPPPRLPSPPELLPPAVTPAAHHLLSPPLISRDGPAEDLPSMGAKRAVQRLHSPAAEDGGSRGPAVVSSRRRSRDRSSKQTGGKDSKRNREKGSKRDSKRDGKRDSKLESKSREESSMIVREADDSRQFLTRKASPGAGEESSPVPKAVTDGAAAAGADPLAASSGAGSWMRQALRQHSARGGRHDRDERDGHLKRRSQGRHSQQRRSRPQSPRGNRSPSRNRDAATAADRPRSGDGASRSSAEDRRGLRGKSENKRSRVHSAEGRPGGVCEEAAQQPLNLDTSAVGLPPGLESEAEPEATPLELWEGVKEWSYLGPEGVEYGMHSLSEFRSWLAGLQQTKDVGAYEDMRRSVCWRIGSSVRTTVWQALQHTAARL